MATLRTGDKGPEVLDLQTRLKTAGFDPGIPDGIFGTGTRSAVIAFQTSRGLSADGIVGPATEAALAAPMTTSPPAPAAPVSLSAFTVALVAKMFPGTPQSNIATNLPPVLAALDAAGLTSTPIILAALATIRAETGRFQPISEGISHFNTSPGGHPFDLYDNRTDLGNKGAPDGASYKGRGFVQLTGRANYTKYGPIIGVPNLVEQPDQGNDPVVAAKLLAAFLTTHRSGIEAALARGDYATARRYVNGGSNGLAEFTASYQAGLAAL